MNEKLTYEDYISMTTVVLSCLLVLSEWLGWSNCKWNSISQLILRQTSNNSNV
jgi:hypothetical protein